MTDTATILIVARDQITCRALTERLHRAGYQVAGAPSAEEALRLARAAVPDAVLIDAALTDEDVRHLRRQIQTSSALSAVPVVLASKTEGGVEDRDRAAALGVDGVVACSLDDDAFLAHLRPYLLGPDPETQTPTQVDYRSVFEDAPLGIYRTTPEGAIVMANQALLDMLGYDSLEELAERDLESGGYHPDYPRTDFKRRMEEDGRVLGLESAWRRKDGSTLYIRESARAVRDESGRIVAYQGSVEDVTESVEHLQRIERLNAILDAIRDVNQLIVREKDPARLIERACRLLVAIRGYRTAWIALTEDGAPLHVAQAGFDQLPDAVIDALADGELQMCGTDALSLPGLCLTGDPADGRLAALYAGERLMAIRLQHAGAVYGLMSVSLPPDIDIDEREQALFEEVAGDIAFALHSIDLEERRAAAAKALREHEANLSALIENTDGSIWSVDRACRLIIGNSVFHRNVKESLGRRLHRGEDVLTVDNGLAPTTEEWRDHYERALAGERFSIEAERHVEGGPRYVEYRFNPVKTADGAVVGATVYGQDVTERRRAAEEIRARSAQLEAVRDVGMRITAELALENLLRSIASQATELLHGTGGGLYLVRSQGQDELLAWSVPIGPAPEPDQIMLQRGEGLAGTVWERGEAVVVEDYQTWQNRSKTWDPIPVRAAVGVPIRWGDEILGVLSLYTDTPGAYSWADARLLGLFADQAAVAIRNARLYEETRELASFNENIVRSMAEGIVLEDADGLLTFLNPAAAELLGYPPDEILERPIDVLIPPDQRPVLDSAEEAVKRGERELFELDLTRRDGTRMPVLVSSAPRFDAEGQFVGTLVVFNDITEQRRAEGELARRAEDLRSISDLAVDLTSAPSMDAFFRLVGEKLKEITQGLFVGVSSYDPEGEVLVVEHVVGESPLIARVAKILGRGIVGLRTPVDSDARTMILDESVGIKEDLAETTLGAVPKPLARAIQSVLGIDHFVGIAFSSRDELLGTAIVVSSADHTHPSLDVLRVFGRVTSAALRQRRADEALRESEERFRVVLENLPGGVFAHDLTGRIVMVSEAAARNTGYARQDLLQMTVADIDPTSGPRGDAETLWHSLETGGAASLETSHLRKDGSTYPADVRLSAVTLRGEPIILAVAFDISERKEAERALQESEERFRALIESAPVSILLLRKGQYIYGNPASAKLLGYDSPEEIVGVDPLETIAPELHARVQERISRIDDSRDNEPMEQKLVKPSGEARWALVTSVSVQMDGEPTAVIVAQDITERKQAQEKLRRLGAAVEQSTEGYVFTDMRGNVIYANPTIESLYGYKLEDLRGEPIFSLNASGDDVHVIKEALRKAESWSGEVEQIRRDGTTFPALLSLFTVTDETGSVDSVVAAVRDITEVQHMEEQLRQQERLAAVGQLAGGIAHDFNNILAAILLYAEMPLNDPRISPATRDALRTILEESHRAADLVQQILDFSRSAMMDTALLDLGAIVEETATLLRRTIPEHIDLMVDVPSRACTIQADPTRIHQALMNLALNAKDAMPDGGELRLTVESLHLSDQDGVPLPGMEPGDWARLTVSDNGTGMTEEAQDHLFEPFFTTKEQGKGTGLGLAQVYGIVKQHEGFIDVETTRGEGTTFTIYLPGEEAAAAAPGDRTGAAEEGRGEAILVVEDAEALRGAIKAGLASLGYRVLTAANGREALDITAEGEVDLVLTDVVMPEMGGEALLRRLRREHPGLGVVAMTGHVMDQDVQKLRASGFSAALPKPFSIEDLAEVVRSVLGRETT